MHRFNEKFKPVNNKWQGQAIIAIHRVDILDSGHEYCTIKMNWTVDSIAVPSLTISY